MTAPGQAALGEQDQDVVERGRPASPARAVARCHAIRA